MENIADVGRLFEALPEERGIRVAYAIGALGGLRTGEVLALSWDAIDPTRAGSPSMSRSALPSWGR